MKVGDIYKNKNSSGKSFVKIKEVTHYFNEKKTPAYIVYAGPCEIEGDLETSCTRSCREYKDFNHWFKKEVKYSYYLTKEEIAELFSKVLTNKPDVIKIQIKNERLNEE